MPSEMDKVQFETIGRNASSSSFSFPKRISGRSPPSLLDRMTSQVATETNVATHVDTNPTRSPKAARSQKQRVRPESQAALVNRISAPDTPALLNRISAPELLPRITTETRVSPSTKKKGPSVDSEPSAEAGTVHVAPHTTKNPSPVPAPVRNSPTRKVSPPILIAAQTPPRPVTGVAHPLTTSIPMQIDSRALSPVASVAFSSAALTVAVPQSTIGTTQPSMSNPDYNPNMESTPLPPSSVLPPPRKYIPAEPEAPLPPAVVPSVEETTSSPALPSISTAAGSVSPIHGRVAPTAPTDSPSSKEVPMASSAHSSTPVPSPTKVTQDMIAFYLKPLWAESAAQMLEWAEVANEREETQKQAQKQKSTETAPNNNNNNQNQELGETLNRGIQRKRTRPDDDEGSGAKRIKLSVAHPVAPSITPPPATPPTVSPSQAEAQSELVVVEDRTTIMDRANNDEGSTKVVEQNAGAHVGAVSPLQATPLVASDTEIPDGGDGSPTQNKPLTPGARQAADTIVPSPASVARLHPQAEGATPRAHAHAPTPELHEEPRNLAASSSIADAIDEAAAIRRRNLEQELAFHQREEQERKRQLELERAKTEAAERLLKEREEVLRKAMKKRKLEKAEAQAVPSSSPTVPIQVTAPVAAPVAASTPLPASSAVVTHISPPRIPHPLPLKPQPLSGVALGTSSGNIAPMVTPQIISPSASNTTYPKTARIASGSTSNPPVMEPTDSSHVSTNNVAPSPPPATPLAVSIPVATVSQQVPFLVKKEEPRTPSISRAVPTVVPPAKARGPSSLKNASMLEPSPEALSRTSPESQANSSSAKASPTSPHLLIKPEPQSDQYLEPETAVKLGKRSRSPSLPASVPPVIKKRRETSPPADLELTYPDGSETSGWGQVDVEQDDEERRTGGRRRLRSLTPEDSEGRDRGRTPVRWQRSASRSRSRSRSPLRPTRGRALPPSRGSRGRGWNARGRPVDGYERRLPPRSPVRRPLRSPSPAGTHEPHNRYSPPLRGGRGRPELGGTEDYPTFQRHYNSSADRRPTHPYTHAPQPGSRFDPNEPEYRLPPRESDSLTRRSLANQSAPRTQNTGQYIPLPRSPPREPHLYLADRAPPTRPSADRAQNAEPSHHPFPAPTSSLLRPRSPPRDTYSQHRAPPVGPSATRSQNFGPPSPPQLPRASSPQRQSFNVVRRSPPVAQSRVRSQHANPAPVARTGGNAPEDLRSSLGRSRNDAVAPSEQYAPAPSRGRGVNRPMSDRAVTSDSQRPANRYRPYSPTRRVSGPAHATVANHPPEPLAHSNPSLSLRDRISPDNQPDTHRAHEGTTRGNSQRGRGAGGSRGGRGGRIKLSDRLSDAQAGGALAGRVGEPQ